MVKRLAFWLSLVEQLPKAPRRQIIASTLASTQENISFQFDEVAFVSIDQILETSFYFN